MRPFAILISLWLAGAAFGQNLVQNPGFEQVDGKLPGGWLVQNRANGNIAVDFDVHASGSRSLRLNPNRRNNRPDKPLGVGQQFRAAGVSGKRLTIRASMRADGGATASLLVFAVGQNGKFIGTAHLEQQSGGGFAIKEGSLMLDPATASIIVGCGVSGTSGTAWFDDVTVAVEDSPISNAPAQKAGPGTLTTASVTIHAGEVIRTLPKTLFGANTEWIYDGHGLWDNAAGQLQPALTALAKDMGIGLIRFPGGVLADYYHWKDGVGPVGSRPSIPYMVAPGQARNTFGTNELIAFCAAIGAEPLLQVNLVTGTAGEAADWVSFTNNKGRPEAWRVHYWELGNEQYMKHPNAETARSYMKVQDYVAKVREFSAAMKGRDASIHLGVVSGENFGNYRIVEDEKWNRTVLQNAGRVIDFIALHDGYAPVVMDQKNVSFSEVYGALLAFPSLLAEHLRKINRDIQQYAPADAGRLKIAITEWGPLFAFAPNSPWVGHTKTLGSALFAASVLQTMFRAERVDIAAFFQLLATNNFSGWIDQHGHAKATARALEMYTRHFGETLVRSSVESPAYASKAVGVVDAVASVPYLDGAASLSADGATLYLTMVNKHLDASIRTTVHVDGFAPRASGRSWVLSASSLDANNGNDLPNLPGANWARQMRAPQRSMFDAGSPETVTIRPGPPLTSASKEFEFEFPPMSLTCLELARR